MLQVDDEAGCQRSGKVACRNLSMVESQRVEDARIRVGGKIDDDLISFVPGIDVVECEQWAHGKCRLEDTCPPVDDQDSASSSCIPDVISQVWASG